MEEVGEAVIAGVRRGVGTVVGLPLAILLPSWCDPAFRLPAAPRIG